MDVSEISKTIKRLRVARGLTLARLARRINTSAATLSRYENGWERFELYTLTKIATALGCRLDIEFRTAYLAKEPKNVTRTFNQIKRLFWDHKLEKRDLSKYPVWVTERIIEYGSLKDIRSLMVLMGKRTFLKYVSECRFGSPKTEAFWKEMLKKEGLSCTKRHFPREAKNF